MRYCSGGWQLSLSYSCLTEIPQIARCIALFHSRWPSQGPSNLASIRGAEYVLFPQVSPNVAYYSNSFA